ncbi:MAG: hypothetical protein ACOCV2_11480, partial [Persicimonas sp.]
DEMFVLKTAIRADKNLARTLDAKWSTQHDGFSFAKSSRESEYSPPTLVFGERGRIVAYFFENRGLRGRMGGWL